MMRLRTRTTLLLLGLFLVLAAALVLWPVPGTVDIRTTDAPVQDWAKLDISEDAYYVGEPSSVEEVQRTVRYAVEAGLPLRIRGRGHSTNASSLPRADELLLVTQNLTHFRALDADTLVVGSGKTLFGVRQWLANYGYGLPVYNMGEVGPSIGGYISAGGIGLGSAEHGGFWENVRWLGLVDGQGRYRRVERDDPLFPWLFGSMGQLGVIVEAAMRIVPIQGAPQQSLPRSGRIPSWGDARPGLYERYQETYRSFRMYSVALFVPEGAEAHAQADLHAFFEPYETVFQLRRTLVLPIRFQSFQPPLLFPRNEAFTAVGIEFVPREAAHAEMAFAVEDAFADFVEERGYRRYIQMELARDPRAIADYFGPATWEAFYEVKQQLDPHGLFGQGLFETTRRGDQPSAK